MRSMWNKFGKEERGFLPEELITEIELIANRDLKEFFALYLHTTTELPFNKYFEPFGLVLEATKQENPIPYLGITVDKQRITFVDATSPAGRAGIDANDELLAIDNLKVTSDTLTLRLENYQAGDIIQLTIFHEEELKTLHIELFPCQPSGYEVKMIENPTVKQKENLDQWLF